MRAALVDAHLDLTALFVLLAWGAVGTLLTARTFTWE
jgi:ABC-2 type transport system permease protein